MSDTNRRAWLDMIAFTEGTYNQGDRGYNVLVGSFPLRPKLFSSYADHPNILVDLGRGLKSTAAGRYQLLHRYFVAYKEQLGLPDFSPASQDAIALQQTAECGALEDIDAGNLEAALQKCRHIWASLPGAGYGQHEFTVEAATEAFTEAGGVLA